MPRADIKSPHTTLKSQNNNNNNNNNNKNPKELHTIGFTKDFLRTIIQASDSSPPSYHH